MANQRTDTVKPLLFVCLLVGLSACRVIQPYSILFANPNIQRIGPNTLKISGVMGLGSIGYFKDRVPDNSTLEANGLRGGSVSETVEIASDMNRRGIDMTVTGHCSSACANYMAAGAKHLTVKNQGVLLFHGGSVSLHLDELNTCGGPDACPIETLQNFNSQLAGEVAFLRKYHLNANFLIFSGKVTADPSDNRLWAPTVHELACYGLDPASFPKDYPPSGNYITAKDLSPEQQKELKTLCP